MCSRCDDFNLRLKLTKTDDDFMNDSSVRTYFISFTRSFFSDLNRATQVHTLKNPHPRK